MSILTLIESSTGNTYRKKASTLGGEFSGPCPWCGGDDRFSIHPAKDHYVCRRCRKAGDSIEFLKTFCNKTYIEACQSLGIQPNSKPRPSLDPADPRHQQRIKWQPREIEYPSETWQSKAESVLFPAYQYLLSAAGRPHRDWLNARGINNETIKAARMGWQTSSVNFDRESWGLQPETDRSGKQKSIWIPAGLIIPLFHNGRPVRLRIRQSDPIGSDRYIVVSGSSMGFFDYTDHLADMFADPFRPVIITESELDGWLLQQELGNNLRVYAVGNSSARPDRSAHEYLKQHQILINLDNDAAGLQEVAWWTKQYPKSIPWLSEFGKDPGECFEVGDDIRAWGLAGITEIWNRFPADLEEIRTDINVATDHRQRVIEEYAERRQQQQQQQKEESSKQQQQVEIKTEEKTIVPTKTINPVCVHGQFCQNLGGNQCLINNKNPWSDIQRCPKNQWYRVDQGPVALFILAPGVSKK